MSAELSGLSLRIEYSSGLTFVVDYHSAERLTWRGEIGTSLTADEDYVSLQIRPRVWMVNWLAVNGVTVTQVLDLEALTASSFMTMLVRGTRSAELLSGTVTVLAERSAVDDETA